MVRGIEIGQTIYETGITPGIILTVLGKIKYNFEDNELSIENP